MPAVEALNLRKVYRTYRKESGIWGAIKGLVHRRYDETAAVDGVSFSVEPGEFVGFLGPNGAGKTTTLKMLSGLVHPSGGDASVLGFVPWERKNAMKRQFALLMGQKNALWWDLPARESLELNRAIYGIEKADFNRTIGELTEMLDVADKLGVMVRELSLGERMKFELMAALLHHPKVIFLDEPTIGLDVISQKKVREFLKNYNERSRITILLTSHYMQDIAELCERVILIDHGKLFFDGPLESVLDRFATTKLLDVEFASPCATDFSRLGRVLEHASTRVRLEVPRQQVADVCRELLACGPVTDFSVQEIPIEEIIRQVFGAQQERQAASAGLANP
jgi:ABC-2 type transport system ATP-binding protein